MCWKSHSGGGVWIFPLVNYVWHTTEQCYKISIDWYTIISDIITYQQNRTHTHRNVSELCSGSIQRLLIIVPVWVMFFSGIYFSFNILYFRTYGWHHTELLEERIMILDATRSIYLSLLNVEKQTPKLGESSKKRIQILHCEKWGWNTCCIFYTSVHWWCVPSWSSIFYKTFTCSVWGWFSGVTVLDCLETDSARQEHFTAVHLL